MSEPLRARMPHTYRVARAAAMQPRDTQKRSIVRRADRWNSIAVRNTRRASHTREVLAIGALRRVSWTTLKSCLPSRLTVDPPLVDRGSMEKRSSRCRTGLALLAACTSMASDTRRPPMTLHSLRTDILTRYHPWPMFRNEVSSVRSEKGDAKLLFGSVRRWKIIRDWTSSLRTMKVWSHDWRTLST